MSLRDDILATRNAAAVPIIPAPTPEWPSVDGKLFIKMLSAFEADIPLSSDDDDDAEENYRAKYVCRCLCDENRNRVLQDDDATYIGHKEIAVVNRLFRLALQHNGMTDDSRKAMRKNLRNVEDDGSPSSSQEQSTPDSA